MTLFHSLRKKKDDDRFKEIFTTHYPSLLKFAKFKLGDSILAEDLVQETFLRLWNNQEKAQDYEKLKSYLFMILNNLIIDEYRKNKLELVDPAEIKEESRDSTSSHEIHHYILELKEDIQSVFLLNKYSGFKYAEIAEILDISIKTVESRMSRALKELKEKIKN